MLCVCFIKLMTAYCMTISDCSSDVFCSELHEAASLSVVHNDPSGDATPSEEYLIETRALVQISRSLDIEIVEHIVVTNSECRRIMKSRPRPNTTAKSAGQHLRDSASDKSEEHTS